MSNYEITSEKRKEARSLYLINKTATLEEKARIKNIDEYDKRRYYLLGGKLIRELSLEWNVLDGDFGARMELFKTLIKQENTSLIGEYLRSFDIAKNPGSETPPTREGWEFPTEEINKIVDYIVEKQALIEQSNYIPIPPVETCEEKNKGIDLDEINNVDIFSKQLLGVSNIPGKQYIPTSDKFIITKIKNALNKIKNYLSEKVKIFTENEWVREISRYALSISLFQTFNIISTLVPREYILGLGYKTPCLVACLPLRHVKLIEVARSGKVLKFRSDGSTFLAQQHGSEDAIKVEFLMLKTEIWMLLVLWMLFEYGSGNESEIDLAKAPKLKTLNDLRQINNIFKIDSDVKKASHEFHNTFPLITNNVIIPNVYLETVSFEENVNFGKDVLRCSLMFRTYRKPRQFFEGKIESSLYGYTNNNDTKMYEVIEFSANLAYRFAKAMNALIVSNNWTIRPKSIFDQENDDVYYNIGIEDIASTVVMSLAGYAMFR